MHPMWELSGPGHFAAMLLMLAWWATVIVGVVLGIRWLVGQGKRPEPDTALATLRERYARGDIDRDEFESNKKDLTRGKGDGP